MNPLLIPCAPQLCSEPTLITLGCCATLALKRRMEVALAGDFSKMGGFVGKEKKEFTWKILFAAIRPAAIGHLCRELAEYLALQSILPSFI